MSVTSKAKLIAKLLRNKEYRDAYVEEKITTSLPFQIRALREQRDWSQAELGNHANMRQNAISRLEDAETGTPSLNTLLRLAHAFDLALLVKFVPFSRLVREYEDVSFAALSANSIENQTETQTLAGWARGETINIERKPNLRLRFDQIFDPLQEGHQRDVLVPHEEFLRRGRRQSEATKQEAGESPLARAMSGGTQ